MADVNLVGQVLADRYEIVEFLKKSPLASIYVATDRKLSRRVVVKVPDDSLLRQAEFRDRFVGEARRLAEVQHAHVVEVIDAGSVGEVLWVVVGYREGGSL